MRRAAPVPRAQPDLLPVGDARCAGRRGDLGRPAPARGGSPDPARGEREDRRAAPAPPGGRAAGPRDGGRRSRVRHRHRRRGAVGARSRGLRGLGGAADDRDRARGAGWPGRDVVTDRELSRVSIRRLWRRAGKPGAPAGPEARSRDPRHALDRADRPLRAAHLSGRRRRAAGADDRSSRAASRGGTWTSTASSASSARASRTGRPAATRRVPMGSTCTSSEPETRPARPLCSSPPMRGR